MRMLDKNFDAKALRVPLATMADAEFALQKVKPSVNKEELVELAAFAKEFGESIRVVDDNKSTQVEVEQKVKDTWGKSANTNWMSWATAAGVAAASVAAVSVGSAMRKLLEPS